MSSETVKTNKRKSIPEKLPGDDAVTYNGFVPADTNDTRTISIKGGPTFTWTLYRGTHLVVEEGDDDDDVGQTAAPSMAQPIIVHSSTGTGSQSSTGGDTSTIVASPTPDVIRADPETDPDDLKRYVYCGKTYNVFILADDLAARITRTDIYGRDWKLADQGLNYIAIWNKGGNSNGSIERGWIARGKIERAQADHYKPGDTGIPTASVPKKIGDNSAKLLRERIDSQTMQWLALAQFVADAPKQVPYNVKARFWVPPHEDQITLVFEAQGIVTQPELQAAVDAAIISSKSRIKTFVVANGGGPGDDPDPNHKRKVFSSHYLGFYDTYVSNADAGRLASSSPRAMPDETTAASANDLLLKKDVRLKQTDLRFEKTELRTSLTAKKIGKAIGRRRLVDTQKKVMDNKSATDFAKKFEWADYGKVGALAASEWLHRSAFSFGGVGDPSNIHSSQTRGNLVFGTSEANTLMIRPEDTIKNLMKAEKADQDRRGFVKSDIKYPGGSTNAWMEREAYTWLAPKLSYVFTFKSEKNISFNGGIEINTFQRVIPLKLEAYIDEHLIKILYAPEPTSTPPQASTFTSSTPSTLTQITATSTSTPVISTSPAHSHNQPTSNSRASDPMLVTSTNTSEAFPSPSLSSSTAPSHNMSDSPLTTPLGGSHTTHALQGPSLAPPHPFA